MTITYDYAACNICNILCVYDRQDLSEAEQDKQCPAVMNGVEICISKPSPNTEEWAIYRAEKLLLIQNIIQQKGPILLFDLAELADVPLITLRSWCVRYFETITRVKKYNKRTCQLIHVMTVVLSKNPRPVGHTRSIREERLVTIRNLVERNGPLPIGEVVARTGIPHGTLRGWVVRGTFLTHIIKPAGNGNLRPGRMIYYITGLC